MTGTGPAARPRLVFLHVPKTGGTSLHHLLQRGFAPEEICPERFPGLTTLEAAALGRWRFFSGHFRMDDVRCIPGETYRVTLLRDPRERILSLYRFWRRVGRSVPSPAPGPRAARDADLAGFLRSDEPDVADAVDNAIARALAGRVLVRPGRGWVLDVAGGGERAVTRLEVAARARDGLLGFDVVGFTERLDAAYAAVAADLGLPPPAAADPPVRLNAADAPRADLQPSPPPPEVTEEAAAALDRATALDRMVVALARDLLAPGDAVARSAARRAGPPA